MAKTTLSKLTDPMESGKCTIRPLRVPGELDAVSEAWDRLTERHGSSPFLLRPYMGYMIDSYVGRGRRLLMASMWEGKELVAAAPFELIKKGWVNFARPLLGPALSSELLADPRYGRTFISEMLRNMLQERHYAAVIMILPAESEYLGALTDACNAQDLHCWPLPAEGHSLVAVNGSWNEFVQRRGTNYRSFIRKTERKIATVGKWRITKLNLNTAEARYKIEEIEKNSWKEAGRKMNEKPTIDRSTRAAIELSKSHGVAGADCENVVWFLEINARPIAYTLFMLYKDVAYALKVSYDSRYKNLYPGIYVLNAAVRDLFSEARYVRIDFLTALGWHRRWAPRVGTRTRFLVTRKNALTAALDQIRRVPKIRELADSLALAIITNQ